MGTWPALAPLTGQLRPHQRSMANIGTACVHVADYANPATLTNTIGTAHGANTSAVAKREKCRKYRDGSLAPLAETYRDLPRTGTAHAWPGG